MTILPFISSHFLKQSMRVCLCVCVCVLVMAMSLQKLLNWLAHCDLCVCVIRRPSISSAAGGANVPSRNPATSAAQTSAISAMVIDGTNMPPSAADGRGVGGSSAWHDLATQSKRPLAADSFETEHDDDRSSKRRRQNSTTNTESSSSLSSVPADRNPISASYSSMLRYQTRVTLSCFPIYSHRQCLKHR